MTMASNSISKDFLFLGCGQLKEVILYVLSAGLELLILWITISSLLIKKVCKYYAQMIRGQDNGKCGCFEVVLHDTIPAPNVLDNIYSMNKLSFFILLFIVLSVISGRSVAQKVSKGIIEAGKLYIYYEWELNRIMMDFLNSR